MPSRATSLITYFAGAAALVGVAIAIESCSSAIHPAEKGRDYLQSKGYTNITGGDRDYFNACGKNIVARGYTATHNGRRVSQEVCFGPFGPYLPWF
jgi:hypothetical protein